VVEQEGEEVFEEVRQQVARLVPLNLKLALAKLQQDLDAQLKKALQVVS